MSPSPPCSTTQTLLLPIFPLLLITHMHWVILVLSVSWPWLQSLFFIFILFFFFCSIHRRQILLIVQGRQGLCSVKLFSLVDYSTRNQLISSLPCKMPAGGISLETSILGFFQENTQPESSFRCKADRLLKEIKSSFFFSLTFEDAYNERAHICLSAWQSVFLLVCFAPLCEQCCAWD